MADMRKDNAMVSMREAVCSTITQIDEFYQKRKQGDMFVERKSDRYLMIEKLIGHKNSTYYEDLFLTKFLDSGWYLYFDIIPQVKFFVDGKYKYRVDFLIQAIGGAPIVVEIDGMQHYEDMKQIEKDKIRDEAFSKAGFVVWRIPNFLVDSTLRDATLEEAIG